MLTAQEIHRLVVSLYLCLDSHSGRNTWILIILTASKWIWHLPKSNCTKAFFPAISRRNYVPEWRKGQGTMGGYKSWGKGNQQRDQE